MTQFDREVTTGEFKAFVISCLSSLCDFQQFKQALDIQVSVEKEQLPEGTTPKEESSDEEYENASSVWMQDDSSAVGTLLPLIHTYTR